MQQPKTPARCAICATPDQLLRCAKCKSVYYCSIAHQHLDWPAHRPDCRQLARQKQQQNNNNSNSNKMQQLQQAVAATTLDVGGANCSTAQMMTPATQAQAWSNEYDELLNYLSQPTDQAAQSASGNQHQPQQHQLHHHHHHHHHPQNNSEKSSSYQIGLGDPSFMGRGSERRYEELCRHIISDMNQFGLSVVDDFLGAEKGREILKEVCNMYDAGAFHDGQLVHNVRPDAQSSTVRGDKIRGDKIKWVGGNESGCSNVLQLTNEIDSVVFQVNTMKDNGILGNYHIRERTRAMVACYPGSGTHYVMHVDNPNKDGRVITAIYYLNVDWDARESGGILRIRPTEPGTTVADIEPKFDRLIFFWSDKRNPHEVQPAHRTRYAITVWYFDKQEREEALNRAKLENSKTNNASAIAQQAEPDSTTTPATPSATAVSSSSISSTGTSATTLSGAKALTPASMTTGSGALNANMASSSCAASNGICT